MWSTILARAGLAKLPSTSQTTSNNASTSQTQSNLLLDTSAWSEKFSFQPQREKSKVGTNE